MKQLFYLSLAFLAITGCRKIEMDGEKEIFVVTKEVTPVGVVSNTITLSGKITKDTTLYAKDVNYLSGLVYITKGVTLTIQEGASVKGKSEDNLGFRLQLTQLTETNMRWEQTISVEGKPFIIYMNFNKINE